MSRGNPNQKKLVEQLKFWGYDVMIKHNQICVPGEEPMTIAETKRFIETVKHRAIQQITL